MGYNDSALQEIWRKYRSEFPVTENLLYLNHAAVAPLARRAAEAMKWLADEHYPTADRIRVVLDNLNTHRPAALYEAFPPDEARRILRRLEFHYTYSSKTV